MKYVTITTMRGTTYGAIPIDDFWVDTDGVLNWLCVRESATVTHYFNPDNIEKMSFYESDDTNDYVGENTC